MIELVLRITFSLIVVLGLMWVLAKVVRRPLAGRGSVLLAVVARQQLSRNASVAVVRVGDQALVVGVTEGQVTLLGETDLAKVEALQEAETEQRSSIILDGPAPLLGHAEPVAAALVPAAVPVAVPVGRRAAQPAAGRLAGSLLSPQTWVQTVEFLRDRTARRS